jgi:ABC-2 type transport system permease protein
MSAFLYSIGLQWKLDIRNKGILLTYYVVPLVFFGFMGGIFTSINPLAPATLIQTMITFGVTMGAFIGSPYPLVEFYGSEMKKSYVVGDIPLWLPAVSNLISSFIHLMILSLIIFIVAPLAFNAVVPQNLLVFFVSLALFIITSLMIGTMLGLMIKKESRLTMISQFFFLPSVMLAGIMFPADMLPKILQYIGMIFPATWGNLAMSGDSWDISNIWPLFIIITIAGLICIVQLKRIKAD